MTENSNTQAALASFLERASLAVLMGGVDNEWERRLNALAEAIAEHPLSLRTALHWEFFERLRQLGFDKQRADDIVNDLCQREQVL